MDIALVDATDRDFTTVKNMSLFYVYELGSACGNPMNDDGTIDYPFELAEYWHPQNELAPLDHRWTDPSWQGFPFIIKVDSQLAGFALIRRNAQGPPPSYEVGHLFVWRKYQRQGVGRYVAHALFDKFRGYWQVCQMHGNLPAQAFWRQTIGAYSNGKFGENAWARMVCQYFDNVEQG